MAKVGKITQIIGPVVDVSFEGTTLPGIYNALSITRENGESLILECQKHLGEDRIRAVAMDATDGLTRGMTVTDLGEAISIWVL